MYEPVEIGGTWDELASRAEELRGRKLKLVVLPDSATETIGSQPDKSLAELSAGRTGKVSFDPTDAARRSEEYFGQIVANRHERKKSHE